MFLLSALMTILISSSNAFAQNTSSYCEREESNALHRELIVQLSEKLSYSIEEFCNHPRIHDLFIEDRMVYNRDWDVYEDHKFITLYYNEYSCQYSYNLETKAWGKQYCYNTF